MKKLTFEWNNDKARKNVRKHNVNFMEAVETFSDPSGLKLDDYKHSGVEVRSYWIGKTKSDRVLTTWLTERNGNIRIIGSAEWREFREYYYEKTKAQ
jgi:uncharacterized DUF497 family protein